MRGRFVYAVALRSANTDEIISIDVISPRAQRAREMAEQLATASSDCYDEEIYWDIIPVFEEEE